MRQPLAQAHAAQERLGARTRLVERQSGDAHRHLGVLDRRELGQQVVELEDEPDPVVAQRHQLGVGHRRELGVADGDRSAIGAVEPAEDVEQGAFPHARRADNRHHFARLDLQIEILQHGQPMAADRVALDDAARVEKRHRRIKCNHEDTKDTKHTKLVLLRDFVPSWLHVIRT